jgi:putative hydrolase of the HAD superfamily
LPYQMLKPDPVLRNILLNVPVRKVVSFLPWLRTL